MDYLAIKKQLHSKCKEQAQQRLDNIQKSVNAVQDAANLETRSTAGDKYDTSRSMMHLEQEKLAKQLSDAKASFQAIDQLDPNKTYDKVTHGSLAITTGGNLYFSVSIGKVDLEGETYFALSGAAPLANVLMGLKVGETGVFNGKKYKVLAVV
ncbi:3-oxoacyl-ACP synthase [Cytophagaceae bacterium ABcell3]|nr:3-oxoacyl-ACP synthase [Cytophagaceae bacterium ABcell3]